MKEVLRGVIFLHRIPDDKDFTEVVSCVPDTQMQVLEAGLKERQEAGFIDMVQIGRHRTDIQPLSPVFDEVDDFFNKIDGDIWPYSSTDRATPSEGEDDGSIPSGASSFTGFDDVPEPDTKV